MIEIEKILAGAVAIIVLNLAATLFFCATTFPLIDKIKFPKIPNKVKDFIAAVIAIIIFLVMSYGVGIGIYEKLWGFPK